MKNREEIKNLIKLPVRTDKLRCFIYDAGGNVIFTTRGYGYFKSVVGKEKASEMQKEMVDYIVNCINSCHVVSVAIEELESLSQDIPRPYVKPLNNLITKLKTSDK